MPNHNTDKDWDNHGKDDPSFGVVTENRFRRVNLTEEKRESFFSTGQHSKTH